MADVDVTLRHLVEQPELCLAVHHGEDALDRAISVPHVSELLDPTPWMEGGELLMTIGLLMPTETVALGRYTDRLARAGVCALALGLGADLPYDRVPRRLVSAAAHSGLALLAVPDGVPFIAVTKAFVALGEQRVRREQEDAAHRLRQSAAQLAAGRGVEVALRAWARPLGIEAVVVDRVGGVIASTSSQDTLRTEAARALAARVRDVRSSAADELDGLPLLALPLGSELLRGVLLLHGAGMGDHRRQTARGVRTLVALLTLELERRHVADLPRRQREADLLSALVSRSVARGERARLHAESGLAQRVRAVALRPPSGVDLVADLRVLLPGALVSPTEDGHLQVLCDAGQDVDAALRRSAPQAPAGLGTPVSWAGAAVSMDEAVLALRTSERTGERVDASETHRSRLLLSQLPDDALRGYADVVLGELRRADRQGTLLALVEAWVATDGSVEETARLLAVHRHTVRHRLDQVQRLTGRDPRDAEHRRELWLAVRAATSSE